METSVFIGKCIYCGGTGQTNEHLISKSLGGKYLLRKASCEKCREITSKWELNPLRDNWLEARAALNYPSSHRDFDKETFPIKVTLKDGSEKILSLKKDELFGLASFLEYPLPGFFSGISYDNGSLITGTRLIGFGSNYKDTIQKYNIKEISHSVTYKGTHFERMIIRMAYCGAIATWGEGCFEECYALPVIMGTKENVGYLMGCDPSGKIVPIIGRVVGDNAIKMGIFQKKDDENIYAIARLKFFSASDAPEYVVILGTLKKDRILK